MVEEIEQFVTIPDFPTYVVSNYGRVFNQMTHRELILTPTLQGDPTVGLMYDPERRQHRRSVKVLVARAFVHGETEIFNTPIQLNGDKWDLRASNIRWRPRWFAWKYTRQFTETYPWFFSGPVLDIYNRIEYETIFEAAITNGNLCGDILRSTSHEIRVFPTGEVYMMIHRDESLMVHHQ
jgi:hypothetical protein